jgi:PAT family beta-lactamase induction signal transducer AmpG
MADVVTGQDEPATARVGLAAVFAALRQPKVALAALFGVATGMPPVMVTLTLGYWLRAEGVALAAIGFMSWVGIFTSIKFLFAPFIDRLRLPWLGRRLGQRRSWMVFGQFLVTIGIFGLAIVGPESGLALFAAFALLTSFGAATQDIAVDAWRIEIADDREQDIVAAAYTFGLRFGYFLASAPILAASAVIGWAGAYAVAALGGVAGFAGALIAREPNLVRDESRIADLRAVGALLWAPVRVFLADHGRATAAILALVAVYFVPDALIAPMIGPLYLDLGFAAPEIAAVRTTFGLGATLCGVLAAGILGLRFGTMATMALGVTLAALSNGGFAILALSGGERAVWIAIVLAEGFSGGFAHAAILAWAGRLTNPQTTGAQFALLSSLMVLLGGFLGGFGGIAIEALQRSSGAEMQGYALFFSLSALACLPALTLMWAVRRAKAPRHAGPA